MYGTIRQLSLQKDLQSVLKRTYKCVCVCVCVCCWVACIQSRMTIQRNASTKKHRLTFPVHV